MKCPVKAKRKGAVHLKMGSYEATRLAVALHPDIRNKEAALMSIYVGLQSVVDRDRVAGLVKAERPDPRRIAAQLREQRDIDGDAYAVAVQEFYRKQKEVTPGQAFRCGLDRYFRALKAK